MTASVAYDVTRLVTRMFNATPNGIDRVDYAFAEHFLARGAEGAVWAPPFGARLMPAAAAKAAVDGIGTHWGEDKAAAGDPAYTAIVAQLIGQTSSATAPPRIREGRGGQASGTLAWLKEYGLPLRRRPEEALPDGATYLNVSQFPLWISSYFEWLERRRDVKAVFFVHDLLPLEMPEYFRTAEYERHRRRLANVARFGTATITTTASVRDGLAAHLKTLGRLDMPILVAPLPMRAVFQAPAAPDPALRDVSYFVCCGTIEPRKNHLMLLHAWRALVERDGPAAPKLVLVGTRGWKYDLIVDLIDRAPALRRHVIEASGLTTPGLRRLMDGARGLVMPSFAEGYGLPVHEALAAGTRVIASDIPVFREIGDPRLTLVSPLDGEAWIASVREHSRGEAPLSTAAPGDVPLADWSVYFDRIEAFVATL